MRKLILVFCLIIPVLFSNAQELSCNILINAEQTGNQNEQIFKTLERSITDFINKTTWTNKIYAPHERIDCSMVITVLEYNGNSFKATIQVQSSRPIFNSTYNSPILNFNDKDFSFEYIEFQNLNFNPNQFNSNLISVLSYYVYLILALDADSFKFNGGTSYYDTVGNIVNVAQGSGYKGWNVTDRQSRAELIDLLQSPALKEYRAIMYRYHYYALDQMSENQKIGKERLAVVLKQFSKLHNRRPNTFLQRIFFDAKSDEILDIFTAGPNVSITDLVDVLNKVSANNSFKWNKIKY